MKNSTSENPNWQTTCFLTGRVCLFIRLLLLFLSLDLCPCSGKTAGNFFFLHSCFCLPFILFPPGGAGGTEPASGSGLTSTTTPCLPFCLVSFSWQRTVSGKCY